MRLIILTFFVSGSLMAAIHPNFVSLSEICPDMKIVASYSRANNFTGVVVDGYKAQKVYLAKGPAEALCEVQKAAQEKGYTLKVFDGYRPLKAVRFFVEWAKKPEDHPGLQELYYPKYTRQQLFQKGFISAQSSHSRGGTVDLTLVNVKTGKEVDMGSGFDYFDEISNTDSKLITEDQRINRMLLKDLMEAKGFKNYHQEWWHYSFRPEPYPNDAFDFNVE